MPSFEADAKLISVSPGGFVTKNVNVMRVDLYEIDALNVPMISRGVVLPYAKTLECSCVCSAGREGNAVYTSLHMMLMEAPVSIIACTGIRFIVTVTTGCLGLGDPLKPNTYSLSSELESLSWLTTFTLPQT